MSTVNYKGRLTDIVEQRVYVLADGLFSCRGGPTTKKR